MSSTALVDELVAAREAACPICAQKRAVPLLWGEPTWEAGAAAQRDDVAFAGCLIFESPPPNLLCRSCGHSWSTAPP